MCLKPSGRGEHECVVHVPNEFTRRLTPPGFEDFKELEQISEGAITPKCARPCRANIRVLLSPKAKAAAWTAKRPAAGRLGQQSSLIGLWL